MKPEDKKKWVDALRSGKFKQGTKSLRTTEDEYCCLGVACEIFGMKARLTKKGAMFNEYSYGKKSGYLPASLMKRLGISEEGKLPNGITFGASELRTLTEINDSGVSFKRIANLIERVF